MLFSMPSYEVKYHDKKRWEKISESKVLGKLQDTYDQVTPVIQQMMEGKQVPTPKAVYRIKGFNEAPFG
jgi:hypothetical protein